MIATLEEIISKAFFSYTWIQYSWIPFGLFLCLDCSIEQEMLKDVDLLDRVQKKGHRDARGAGAPLAHESSLEKTGDSFAIGQIKVLSLTSAAATPTTFE